MICPCGQPLEGTSALHYTIRHYNDKNEVIYEMCIHGHITVDKRDTETYRKEE